MALLIYSFKEEMFNMVILKDDFLYFCEVSTVDNDSNYLENYFVIKREWKVAKKPKKDDFEDSMRPLD